MIDIEKKRRGAKDWARRNAEANRQRNRDWYAKNRETIRAARAPTQAAVSTAWREKNRPAHRAASLRWQKANLPRCAAKMARRDAQRIRATPAWANEDRIRIIYAAAAQMSLELGIPMQVDHRVPLRSKFVCGLHCEANLQVIPGVLNASKSNRHWPGM